MPKFDNFNFFDNFLDSSFNLVFYPFVIFICGKFKENLVFFPLVMNAFPVINDSGENFAFLKKVLCLQIICPEIRLFQFFLYFLKFFLFAVQFKDNPGG
jgi:hypothetical protein